MVETVKRDRWVVIPKWNPQARLRLICLPYAGGNSNAFRSWAQYLSPSVELCNIELPGRGFRLAEDLYRNIKPLIRDLAAGIKPYLDKPFAIFGHSMGALTGFELTHRLLEDYGRKPVHLFLSGRGAPHLASREEPIHHLPENDFVEKIKNYNGTPGEVLQHEELMNLMVPILRADFEVCETYEYTAKEAQLDVPLTVFGGLKDESALREDLESWKDYTRGSFNVRMFPGDHFYLLSTEKLLVETILRDINNHFKLG